MSASGVPEGRFRDQAGPELERLAFFVGEWRAVFDAQPGDSSPEMTGEVRTRWGVDRAWIESDFVAVPRGAPLRGPHPRRLLSPNQVAFLGSAAGKWQKVTYDLLDPGHLDFLVEEAGAPEGPWTRHSHATLTSKPGKR